MPEERTVEQAAVSAIAAESSVFFTGAEYARTEEGALHKNARA